MKQLLRQSIDGALARLQQRGVVPADAQIDYQIETPKNPSHGDFSTNAAMLLAKACRCSPREIAQALVVELDGDQLFQTIEIAGPGFINFVVEASSLFDVVGEVLQRGEQFGRHQHGAGQAIQVEFVSANPTGPLHIGHGRGAAIGSVIANLLDACGYAVTREYYVNDAGRQMDILSLSVYLRYLQASGETVGFPAQAYQGDYISEIAASVKRQHGSDWVAELASSEPQSSDPERALDQAIEQTRKALGEQRYGQLRALATEIILDQIRGDLSAFGVEFDTWYSEASLAERGLIDQAVGVLRDGGHLYQDAGACWFRSSALGDEKDRVVIRENGQKTYFASDIAYHLDKFDRGFAHVIDIWGADHHGYVPRVNAAINALGRDANQLEVVLVQFAALVRGGEKVAMSTRSGEFVTLKSLVDEVGVDAARFFYVMRRADQHLEFDLDLATSKNNENPVYYVQYAHARICSVLRQLEERGIDPAVSSDNLASELVSPAERQLAMSLARYPEVILNAALEREPHALTQYLRDLAQEFHGYYNSHKFLLDDVVLRAARLALISAAGQVFANGLSVLGITAPEKM